MCIIEQEIWKPIFDYESLYEISNHGRVKALARIQSMPNGKSIKLIYEKILKLQVHRSGHLYIQLYKNKVKQRFYIHRLVANHFVYNPDPSNYVNVLHYDDIPTNNYYLNLSFGTQQMNIKDKVRNGKKYKKHKII